MLSLGHHKHAKAKSEEDQRAAYAKKKVDTEKRQAKAGIKILKTDWGASIAKFGEKSQALINDLIGAGKIAEGEIDESELRALYNYSDEEVCEILCLFRDGNFSSKIGNKSGFLAGIIRRYAKDCKSRETKDESVENKPSVSERTEKSDIGDQRLLTRRERKKADEQEVLTIMEDEGLVEEESGVNADDLDKLTGSSLC